MVPIWPGLLVLLLAAMPEAVQALLAWDRAAIGAGEWWRLWSGHFVHFGWLHAAADGGVLLAAALCAPRAMSGPRAGRLSVLALVLAPVLLSVVLWAALPGMAAYRGASGLAAMVVVAVCVAWLRVAPGRGAPRARTLAVVGLVALFGKILVETIGGPAGGVLPPDVVVAWPAHAVGALLGLAWTLALPRAASVERRERVEGTA